MLTRTISKLYAAVGRSAIVIQATVTVAREGFRGEGHSHCDRSSRMTRRSMQREHEIGLAAISTGPASTVSSCGPLLAMDAKLVVASGGCGVAKASFEGLTWGSTCNPRRFDDGKEREGCRCQSRCHLKKKQASISQIRLRMPPGLPGNDVAFLRVPWWDPSAPSGPSHTPPLQGRTS